METVRLKDSKNLDVGVLSKLWVFAKIKFTYDLLEQEYYCQIELFCMSPPFQIDGRLLRRTDKRKIVTREGTLKLSEFQSNIIGRISKFKVHKGELGNWRDYSSFNLLKQLRSPMQYCEIGSSAQLFTIDIITPTKMVYSQNYECDFCLIKLLANPDLNYQNF